MKKMIAAVFCLLIFAGCATTKDAGLEAFYQRMESRVGVKTYDDCLELWGSPASTVQGDSVMIVSWERDRGSTGPLAMPVGGMLAVLPEKRRGERLEVVFDKNTRLMKKWSHWEW